MSAGVDYAFNPHPSISAMKGAGVRFACRYISSNPANDQNGKNLTPPECKALLAAGLQVVVVVEEGASMMLGGRPAGKQSAEHANSVVKALGMASIPVYFAADFDATPAQQDPINNFLDGAASVIGRGRTGIYGGFYPVKRALDANKATYAWQTVAWSGGQWDSRAHIRQGLSFSLGGASVDHDQSIYSDFGQWPRPKSAPAADAKPWRIWETKGNRSLGEIGTAVGMAPSSILRHTVQKWGPFDAVIAAYVTGVFDGSVAPTAPIPDGGKLWVQDRTSA